MKVSRLLVLLFLFATASAQEPTTTDRGLFLLAYKSTLDPIAINQMHSWQLILTTADGEPVEGKAKITVTRVHQICILTVATISGW